MSIIIFFAYLTLYFIIFYLYSHKETSLKDKIEVVLVTTLVSYLIFFGVTTVGYIITNLIFINIASIFIKTTLIIFNYIALFYVGYKIPNWSVKISYLMKCKYFNTVKINDLIR